MGINFAITIGAMAAQIGLLLTINWRITGVLGILTAAGVTLPLAMFFGFLIGKLLNKMKGQETIGSLILGYFANGAYQLLFLFIFGTVIPLNDNVTIVGASGVQNTLNLTGDTKLYTAVDGIVQIPFLVTLYVVCALFAVWAVIQYARKKITIKRFGVLLAHCQLWLPACLPFRRLRKCLTRKRAGPSPFRWLHGFSCCCYARLIRS